MAPLKPLFILVSVLLLGISSGATPAKAAEERKLGQFTYSREKITVTQPSTGKKTTLKPEDKKQLLAQLTQASTLVTSATLNQISPFGSSKKGSRTIETRYSGKLLRVKGDKRIWFVRTDTKQRVYFDGTDASFKFFFIHIDPTVEAGLAAAQKYEAAKEKLEKTVTGPDPELMELSIDLDKEVYSIGERTGFTFNISYKGKPFEAIVMHEEGASGSKPGSTTMQRETIGTEDLTKPSKIVLGGALVGGFSEAGRYETKLSVYACADIEKTTGHAKCGSGENYQYEYSSPSVFKDLAPVKSVTKTFEVK